MLDKFKGELQTERIVTDQDGEKYIKELQSNNSLISFIAFERIINSKTGNTIGYTIVDIRKKSTITLETEEIKQLMSKKKMKVANLTLTSDYRLVRKALPLKNESTETLVNKKEVELKCEDLTDYKLTYGRNDVLAYFKFNHLDKLYTKGYINKQDLDYYRKDLAYKSNYGYVGNSGIGTVAYFTEKEGVINSDDIVDYLDKVYTEHVINQLKNKEDKGGKYDNMTELELEIKLCCKMLKLKNLIEYGKLVEGTLDRAKEKLNKEKIYNNYRNIHRVYNYGYDKGIHDSFMIDNNIRCKFMHAWNGIMKEHSDVISKIEFKKEYNIKDFITILYKLGYVSKQEVAKYNKQKTDTIIKEIKEYQNDKVVYAETLFASIMEFMYILGNQVTEYGLLGEKQLYQGLLLMTANRNKLIDSELINVLSTINKKQENDIKDLLSSFNSGFLFYVRDEYKSVTGNQRLIESGQVEQLIRDRFIKEKRLRHTASTMYDYLTTIGVIKDEYKNKTAQQLEDEEQAAFDKTYSALKENYGKYLLDSDSGYDNLVDLVYDLWFGYEINNRPDEDDLYDTLVDFDSGVENEEEGNRLVKDEYRGKYSNELKNRALKNKEMREALKR